MHLIKIPCIVNDLPLLYVMDVTTKNLSHHKAEKKSVDRQTRSGKPFYLTHTGNRL